VKILEEEPPLADECKLPWIIDAFLYPISAAGMIHLAVFVFLPIVFSFFINLLTWCLEPIFGLGTSRFTGLLTLLFYIVFFLYMFYYLNYCIFNSSKGNRRASDAPVLDTFGIGDFVSQVILILGCIAVCFWPVAVYYILIRQKEVWFWLLLACGIFFLPMSLLRGVLFDAFAALNPIEIFRSIGSIFLPYCGLVIFFFAVGGFIATVVPRLPLWHFILATVRFYLIFVLLHRLGWFYWWHKDRLDWGI
jgi:hypothetical protein